MQCITSDKFDRKGRRVKRSGEGEIMVIIACVRHQLSVMGMRTQYALGPDNRVKLKANLKANILFTPSSSLKF